MHPRYFRQDGQPLFGVFHPARSRSSSADCVLMCPPIGHEYIRSHWALRSLASSLARESMNVLRFDYLGIGDSAKDVSDVGSLETWVDDTCDAAVELLDEVGESDKSITIVGLRFGAAIATSAASQLADDGIGTNLILWEPVFNGRQFLAELRSMHRQMLDLWVTKTTTENTDSHEEILGFRYARTLLEEIETTDLLNTPAPPSSSVRAYSSNGEESLYPEWLTDWVLTEDTYDWGDANYIEEAWLPTKSRTTLQAELKQYAGGAPTQGRRVPPLQVDVPGPQLDGVQS